jgi:hypothetical protein
MTYARSCTAVLIVVSINADSVYATLPTVVRSHRSRTSATDRGCHNLLSFAGLISHLEWPRACKDPDKDAWTSESTSLSEVREQPESTWHNSLRCMPGRLRWASGTDYLTLAPGACCVWDSAHYRSVPHAGP